MKVIKEKITDFFLSMISYMLIKIKGLKKVVKKKLLLKKKENVIWLNHNREALCRGFSGFGEIDRFILHTTSNSVTSTKRSLPSSVFHKDARFQAKRVQRTLTSSQRQTVSSLSPAKCPRAGYTTWEWKWRFGLPRKGGDSRTYLEQAENSVATIWADVTA